MQLSLHGSGIECVAGPLTQENGLRQAKRQVEQALQRKDLCYNEHWVPRLHSVSGRMCVAAGVEK